MLESPAMRAVIEERDRALEDQWSRPGVTVCIPCFNQVEYLGEALASVHAQTVEPLEVIVVDDGSTQNVGALVSEWACSLYCPLHYLRVTNRGLPNARNVALMHAKGLAFLPLDADDWIDPHYIERTYPLIERGADVVQVGLEEHGHRQGKFFPGYDMPLSSVSYQLERQMNRLFYCALIRTSVLRLAGGWNGRMIHGWEDWDLWCDLLKRGVRFDAVDEILFHYRVKQNSMAVDAEQHRGWNLQEMARHHDGW